MRNRYSQHAESRVQQRGIPPLVHAWLLDYGEEQYDGRGGVILQRQVNDPALVAKLTPDYAMGCKRVLMSNDFYPAISAPNVELVTTPIRAVETDSVTDAAGVKRPADIIILGTGFQATAPVPAGMIIGRDGQDLNRLWSEGPAAYKGTTVAGFPNFFTLLGPNVNFPISWTGKK